EVLVLMGEENAAGLCQGLSAFPSGQKLHELANLRGVLEHDELVASTEDRSSPAGVDSRQREYAYGVFQVSLNCVGHEGSNEVRLPVHHCPGWVLIQWYDCVAEACSQDVRGTSENHLRVAPNVHNNFRCPLYCRVVERNFVVYPLVVDLR